MNDPIQLNDRKNSDVKTVNKLTDETIELLSKNIVDISQKVESLRYYYERLGWEPDACYNIEEGLTKFGVALAVLELDKRESEKEEEKNEIDE